jgi:hypothetical protein
MASGYDRIDIVRRHNVSPGVVSNIAHEPALHHRTAD